MSVEPLAACYLLPEQYQYHRPPAGGLTSLSEMEAYTYKIMLKNKKASQKDLQGF